MKIKVLLAVMAVLVSSGIACVIWLWGNPVPLQIRLLEKLDTNQDGQTDVWRFDTSGQSDGGVSEIDSDHDGVVDRLEFRNPKTREVNVSDRMTSGSKRKQLAVCLDGVPYEVMAQLWDEGLFREF